MCTLNESLKTLSEKVVSESYEKELKEKVSFAIASVYADYRQKMLEAHFAGADEKQLAKELTAFNADTKNGTRRVIKGIDSRVNKEGKLIDEEGKVVENALVIGSVKTTDKDGNTRKTTQVFSAPYVADTFQRNISIIASWLEYRSTISDSFAYLKQLEEEKKEKEIKELTSRIAAHVIAGNIEKAQELAARIKELKGE